MPELMNGAVVFGFIAAGLSWAVAKRSGKGWRLPFWGVIVIGVVAAYVVLPILALAHRLWNATPGLPEFTGSAVILGLWVALVASMLFERKGQPRRIPIWGLILIAVVTTLALPPLIDRVTGAYQRTSLRPDANACTNWVLGENSLRQVTNICDYPITVGLCMPEEKNPAPCSQSSTLAPGAMAEFDPEGTPLSSLPSNLNGYTIVACRPPHRPSRTQSVIGRGYDGVCLPEG